MIPREVRTMTDAFATVVHASDICVVGGGLAGLCVAVSAARMGARVVLMHERPMLGGNASSECRVPISGAERNGQLPNMRETGILEELRLDNLYHNRQQSYSVWDTLLYALAQREPNIELLLNCTCTEATMAGPSIATVAGWQMTTQTRH
ncbi:MAG: FAD-dependent oxidoreductase, partial [Chloroflexi bacterium]|nr:FAD-dependent oxidoreductase [Chloroflexota bacterium]